MGESVRTFFSTGSTKDGLVTVHVYQPPWEQAFFMPTDGVPEALRWLEPAFAHYVAQFDKYLVSEQRFEQGFAVPALEGPIADEPNWPALDDVLRRHMPPYWTGTLRAMSQRSQDVNENLSWYQAPDEFGITPFLG
jgi:hypothetical protein